MIKKDLDFSFDCACGFRSIFKIKNVKVQDINVGKKAKFESACGECKKSITIETIL